MYEAEVAAGAEWLDEQHPGWERNIDLGTLELASCKTCVLGQVFGDYTTATHHYWADSVEEAQRRGFSTNGHLYPVLTELWIALIKERFSTGNLSDSR